MEIGSGIRRNHEFHGFLLFFFFFLMMEFSDCQSDILAQNQELKHGSQLISANGIFTLGFYNPRNLNTCFLGIWYNRDSQKPAWIANRNSPIPIHRSPILSIDGNGSLKIFMNGGKKGGIGYSFSLFEVEEATKTSAILMDNGNFVLRELNPDGSEKRQLWQSFDYPTDTLLPGMKLGINHKTGSTWSLTSWSGEDSPLPGAFTLEMNPNNTNQLVILLRDDVFWISGNWEGGRFESSKELSSINNPHFNIRQLSNANETYFNYSISGLSYYRSTYAFGDALPLLRLDYDGKLVWSRRDLIVYCPFFENEFVGYRKSDGCVREKLHEYPECRNPSEYISNRWDFGIMEGNSSKYNKSENLSQYECEKLCISNCDCFAYASINEDATGCEIWGSEATFRFNGGGRLIRFLYIYEDVKPKIWVICTVMGVIGAAFVIVVAATL